MSLKVIILSFKNFRVIPLNQLYMPVKNKTTGKCTIIMTKEGKECKKLIQMSVLAQKQKNILKGDLLFYVDIVRKGKVSPDIDGLQKILQDSLEGLCYVNDNQIMDLRVRKHLNQKENEVNIKIDVIETK